MGEGAGGMADAFVSLGDKLHKNINSSIDTMTANRDMVEKYEHLRKQLEFDKDKFGLEFALKKLMAMKELDSNAKQMVLMELTQREGVKSSALKRQAAEKNFRSTIDNDRRKAIVGKSLALGFANAMKSNAKDRTSNKSNKAAIPLDLGFKGGVNGIS